MLEARNDGVELDLRGISREKRNPLKREVLGPEWWWAETKKPSIPETPSCAEQRRFMV